MIMLAKSKSEEVEETKRWKPKCLGFSLVGNGELMEILGRRQEQ